MLQKNLERAKAIENPEGVVRRTLAYNKDTMLCHFKLKKGARIPLHSHAPSQIGYVVSGRVRFLGEKESDAFEAGPGDAYVIDPDVTHGAEALQDTVYVEVFSPSRPEYEDF